MPFLFAAGPLENSRIHCSDVHHNVPGAQPRLLNAGGLRGSDRRYAPGELPDLAGATDQQSALALGFSLAQHARYQCRLSSCPRSATLCPGRTCCASNCIVV